jgi:hypothetical protein
MEKPTKINPLKVLAFLLVITLLHGYDNNKIEEIRKITT